jgi:hypothetical protein
MDAFASRGQVEVISGPLSGLRGMVVECHSTAGDGMFRVVLEGDRDNGCWFKRKDLRAVCASTPGITGLSSLKKAAEQLGRQAAASHREAAVAAMMEVFGHAPVGREMSRVRARRRWGIHLGFTSRRPCPVCNNQTKECCS